MSAPPTAPAAAGISLREFARREGCDDALVRRAVRGGKLRTLGDGTLDPELVGSGWRRGNRHPAAGADTPADSGADSADTPPESPHPVRTSVSAPDAAAPDGVRTDLEPQPQGGALQRQRRVQPPPGEDVDLDAFRSRVLAGDIPDLVDSEKVKAAGAALRSMVAARREADAVVELEVAEAVLFEASRQARDAWLNWPVKVGPLLAADLGVPVDKVVEALTLHVQQQLEDLGEPQPDWTPGKD